MVNIFTPFLFISYMRLITEGRMKLVILFSLLTTSVFAEPPSPYGRIALRLPTSSSQGASGIVNQRLLDRVADIISQGGDGSRDESQIDEGSSIVDSELLDRIARIINQNEEQTAGLPSADLAHVESSNQPNGELSLPHQNPPSKVYGPPSTARNLVYGAPPPPQIRKLSGAIELGKPELARRIASFDFQDDEGQNSLTSGYSSPSSYSSDSYTSSLPAGGGLGRIQFISAPQTAERIAAFDLSDSPSTNDPPSPYSAPQVKGGYQSQ